jgi:hypothetical protein
LTGVEGIEGPIERTGEHYIVGTTGRLDLWRVHLLMGHLHRRYRIVGFDLWKDNPELREEVAQLLLRIFGLDEAERTRDLDRYSSDIMGIRLMMRMQQMQRDEAVGQEDSTA